MTLAKSLVIAFSALTAATAAPSAPISEPVPAARGEINWSDGVLRAAGTGLRPGNAESATQARLLARRAALADAYRNLAQVVNDVRVTANSTVQRHVATDDSIRIAVDAYVRGAQVVDETEEADGTYRVTLQTGMAGRNGLTGILLPSVLPSPAVGASGAPRLEVQAAAPTPAPEAVPSAAAQTTPPVALPAPVVLEPELLTPAGAQGPFTGVIIDARGFNVGPSMSPRVYDASGKEVYGTVNVDADFAEEVGIAGYMGTIRAAMGVARVGKQPLVIRASGTPDAFRHWVTISDADAQRVIVANRQWRFLEKSAVILVVDERRSRDEGK